MVRNFALTLFAFALLFGSLVRSNAQTIHNVSQIGSVNGALGVSVTGNTWIPGGPPQTATDSGVLNISGYLGNLGMNISRPHQRHHLGHDQDQWQNVQEDAHHQFPFPVR